MADSPKDRLKKLTAWDTEPQLTDPEIDEVLAAKAIADTDGNDPENDNWSPTYDLNAAAAEAWLIKAGRASALVEVDPPGSGIVTAKVFENCCEMALLYTRKRRLSVSMPTAGNDISV